MPILLKVRRLILGWARSEHLISRFARVCLLGMLVNLLFGQMFYLAEKDHVDGLSLSDSLWWTFVTATTVGYGDYYPTTAVGRYLVALPLMVIGVGLAGAVIGIVTDAAINFSNRKRKGIMNASCNNHIVICSYPGHQKILNIAEELRSVDEYSDADIVLVTEAFDELPVELVGRRIIFVRGNCTQEEILDKANLREARGVIILAKDVADIRSDERTFAIATVVKKYLSDTALNVTVTAELVSPRNLEMMRCSGVDRIVSTAGIGSSLLVQEFLNAGMQVIFSELITNVEGHHVTLVAPQIGRSLLEYQRISLDRNLDFQVIGLVRADTGKLQTDRAETAKEGDRLMLLSERFLNSQTVREALAANRD